MRAYVSCNCNQCKATSSRVKTVHKVRAHRALRRAARKAIRTQSEAPVTVTTGYKD
jgi:hypothetical protein